MQQDTAAPQPPETHAAATPPAVVEISEPALVAPPAVSALPDVAVADDAAKWDAIAEEIRMQVLQRIDLFTDTGLREQLGMRLKPIVDRASADLVATINLHVGELLRALRRRGDRARDRELAQQPLKRMPSARIGRLADAR